MILVYIFPNLNLLLSIPLNDWEFSLYIPDDGLGCEEIPLLAI